MNLRVLFLMPAVLITALANSGCASLTQRSVATVAAQALDDLPADQRARLEDAGRRLQARREAQQAQYAQAQRQRIDALNRATTLSYAKIERSGGLRVILEQAIRDLKAQIAAAGSRAAGSQAAAQLGTLQAQLGNIAFCTQPMIFGTLSYPKYTGQPEPQDVVEPNVFVLIEGCHLGATKGQVQLVLSTHETLAMNVINWRDDSVTVVLPKQVGRIDQAAQLVLTAADGNRSQPLDIQFQATRVWTYVDPVMHPGVLFADCRHNTTTDTCQALARKGPPQTLWVAAEGAHFTFCCSSVAGTDRWVLSLRNGWSLAGLTADSGDAPPASDMPDVYYGFYAAGYTTCNFFNREGRVTDYRLLPSSDPRFQGELDISWWVDHSCSGIEYVANIPIIGPEGVPYW